MKLGKKVLSCVLAIMIIVSSVSASFGVFAATDSTDGILSAIETHYAGFKEAIAASKVAKDPDTSRIPTGSGKNWVVKQDTTTGGWQALAWEFAEYIQGTAGTNTTLVKAVDAIKAKVPERIERYNILKAEDYYSVLEYLKFATATEGDHYGSTSMRFTLTIGCGYDLLAWKTVEEIETDLTYTTGKLTIATYKGDDGNYRLSGSATKFDRTVLEDPKEMVTTIAALKDILLDCVSMSSDAGSQGFYYWFNKRTPLLEEELEAFAALFNAFTDLSFASNSDATSFISDPSSFISSLIPDRAFLNSLSPSTPIFNPASAMISPPYSISSI